jgi:hypothetical protein
MPSQRSHFPLEYANCENRPTDFTVAVPSLCKSLELCSRISRLETREMSENRSRTSTPSGERKELTPAAKRALAEAEARRQAAEANARPAPKELRGPKGPEPTRYGDWESKGIASDF